MNWVARCALVWEFPRCWRGNGNARRNTATLNKSFKKLRRTLPQKIALDFSLHRAMHGGRACWDLGYQGMNNRFDDERGYMP
jgi:hypothetical protein